MNKWTCLYTREQALLVLCSWGIRGRFPLKHSKVTVTFDPGMAWKTGEVAWTDMKSTYGKRLYLITIVR